MAAFLGHTAGDDSKQAERHNGNNYGDRRNNQQSPPGQEPIPLSKSNQVQLDRELVDAISRLQVDQTRSLLERGADPQIKSLSPLIFAQPLRIAIMKDADVQDDRATSQAQIEIVEMLIEAGADLDGLAKNDRQSALHYAARRGKIAIIEALVRAGAELEKRDDTDLHATALYQAAVSGQPEAVEVLIQAGADPESQVCSQTALYECAGSRYAVFREAHLECVKVLVTGQANVNAVSSSCLPILQAAVGRGWREMVEILVLAGADVNCSHRGRTPLSIAEFEANECIRRMREGIPTWQAELDARRSIVSLLGVHGATLKEDAEG